MPQGGTTKGQQSDDDDDFFKPASNSTLAKIFGISKNSSPKKLHSSAVLSKAGKPAATAGKLSDRYGSSSFRYVPPQEVAVNDDESISKEKSEITAEWNLMQASVVTAYKLVNNENELQGKLGLALLRSGSEFKILIYRTKTDAIATLNVSTSTKLFFKNDYLQFQSDDECFWSVLFENRAERDRLLATIEGTCSLDQGNPQPKPIPASRTIPLVEEPDSEAEKSRANLISRMARVGQPILPHDKTAAASTTEISDSSDTDARIETIPRSSMPHHRRTGSSGKIHPVTIGMQMVPSAANALSTAIAGQNMLQTATDVNFNLFMTENRMHGTEVRMNLSKLESKLDRVMDKIELINLHSSHGAGGGKSAFDKDEDILALEEKILELKRENHTLKGKLRSMETEISSNRDDSMAKERLAEVEKCCTELRARAEQLQRDVQAGYTQHSQNLKEIDQMRLELEAKNQIIDYKTKTNTTIEEQLNVAQLEQKALYEKNVSLNKQLESLQESAKVTEQELASRIAAKNDGKPLDDLVKEIMNNCFQRLCDQIDDARVLKVIGHTIKQETKAALERQKTK